MIRREHRIAAWLALIAVVACQGRDRSAPAAQPGTPAVAQSPAPAPSPAPVTADASRPNAVLNPDQWTDPQVRAAYAAAKKYAAVLEQLYCYCHCKENMGHRALVQCFESDHASQCDICMTEAMIAKKMTEEGRSPKEIQKAIDTYYANS